MTQPEKVSYRFIPASDGVPLCVGESGNPAGPPILFLPGFSQSQAVFTLQFNSGLARDYRLIGLDFRGHGSSGKPWDESAYKDSRIWGGDIDAVLRELGAERPVVVAWSFGGYVTMDYVRHFSAAGLAGIVFVSSHAGLGQGLPRTAQQEAGRQAQVQMLLQSPPDLRAGIAYGHDFVRQMTTKPLSPEMYEIMLVSHMQLPAYARRAMATRGLENADLLDQLRLPVRFLIGQTDSSPYISEPLIRGLSEKVPSGSLTIMPDAGHAVFVDAPDEFNAELGRFMASLPGR
jgi:non-heme chloroperoxidase